MWISAWVRSRLISTELFFLYLTRPAGRAGRTLWRLTALARPSRTEAMRRGAATSLLVREGQGCCTIARTESPSPCGRGDRGEGSQTQTPPPRTTLLRHAAPRRQISGAVRQKALLSRA